MIIATAMGEVFGWGGLLGGMVLSFIYSGVETGAYVVNKVRLDLRAEAGSRRARRLRRMLRQPDKPLVVILIGNNLANYLASAGLVMILTARAVTHTDWYSVAILTPLVFIFCELLPKNLFQRHGETLTYAFGGFLDLSRRLFTAVGLLALVRGLMWLILAVGGRRRRKKAAGGDDDGIAGLLAEGRASGVLTHAQSVMAERLVNIGQVSLRDVMVPLDQAELVPQTVSTDQIRDLLAACEHPRFGVYAGERENIVGVINAYDVLLDEDAAGPASHIAAPIKLAEELGVTEALVQLQRNRTVVGFVYGRQGHCVGLVGVKDLLEEIVGELEEW